MHFPLTFSVRQLKCLNIMIRFRSHRMTVILAFFLLIFLEGSSCASRCTFADLSPVLPPSHTCNPSHSDDVEHARRGGDGIPLCGSAGESGSTSCSCEHEYTAATDAYRNPLSSQDAPAYFLSPGEVIPLPGTPGHKDRIPAGESPLPNPILTALRTVVLLN
jgi:hypothetical protein